MVGKWPFAMPDRGQIAILGIGATGRREHHINGKVAISRDRPVHVHQSGVEHPSEPSTRAGAGDPSFSIRSTEIGDQIVCRYEVSTEPGLDGGFSQCYAELRFAHSGEAKDVIPIVRRSSGFTTRSIRFMDRTCESVERRSFHRGWPIRCEARLSRAVLRWCRPWGGTHQLTLEEARLGIKP